MKSKLRPYFFAIAVIVAQFAVFSAQAQTNSPTTNAPNGAQSAPVQLTEEQKMDRRIEHLEHMQKRLGLTDEQVAQIRSVWQTNRAKLVADRAAFQNSSGGARRMAHRQLNQDRKSTMAQVKNVLTPDQQKKFADIQGIRRERRIERRSQNK